MLHEGSGGGFAGAVDADAMRPGVGSSSSVPRCERHGSSSTEEDTASRGDSEDNWDRISVDRTFSPPTMVWQGSKLNPDAPEASRHPSPSPVSSNVSSPGLGPWNTMGTQIISPTWATSPAANRRKRKGSYSEEMRYEPYKRRACSPITLGSPGMLGSVAPRAALGSPILQAARPPQMLNIQGTSGFFGKLSLGDSDEITIPSSSLSSYSTHPTSRGSLMMIESVAQDHSGGRGPEKTEHPEDEDSSLCAIEEDKTLCTERAGVAHRREER
jgi:hypothetical protein